MALGSIPTGAIRYNTDSNKMECFNGTKWMQVAVSNPDLNGGTRGFNMGGYSPDYTQTIEYVNIATQGDSVTFGDLLWPIHLGTAGGNKTRALHAGGAGPHASMSSVIGYITVSSTGDALDFGDTTVPVYGLGATNNQTRMVHMAGYWPGGSRNDMHYNTIASTGDSVDFGDAVQPTYAPCDCNSPTRGILVGGNHPTPGTNHLNVLQYITISTTGASIDFGDVAHAQYYSHGGASSATRGVFGGAYQPSMSASTDYITMATLGNSVNFGDLLISRFSLTATSSTTRGIFMGGRTPTLQDTIDYITIATQGDAVDFGNKQTTFAYGAATSNGHGGL